MTISRSRGWAVMLQSVPQWLDKDAWQGFEDMRRAVKKPLTPRAAMMVLAELQRIKSAGHCPNEALDQSTNHCWADVYVPKQKEIERKAANTADDRIESERAAAAKEKARVDAYIARTTGNIRRVA